MPIIKPFMTALRFHATIGDGTGAGATFAIPADAFLDDSGNAVTAFPASFAYYNLYINGMIQPGNTSSIDNDRDYDSRRRHIEPANSGDR